jgi:multidrug efflux system outer membrane protein
VLAEDEAALAVERHTVRVLRHALAVLVTQPPGVWAPPAAADLGPLTIEAIAIGDPAGLLQRRPDVRAAERALAAETAEIGIATAGLFPQVRLGGFLGFVAGGVGDLGSSGSESWFAGPSITWGLFDLGRVRAQIRRSKAEAEAALAVYEQAVLRALEDTQNAFSSLAAAQETLGATDSQVRNARLAAEQIEARYHEGAGGYFELLDARRAAVRAEIARVDSLASGLPSIDRKRS